MRLIRNDLSSFCSVRQSFRLSIRLSESSCTIELGKHPPTFTHPPTHAYQISATRKKYTHVIKSTYLRATYSLYLSHTSTLYVCDKQSTRNCSTGRESLVFTSLRVFCAVILPVITRPPLSLSLCFGMFVMIRHCCQRGHEDLCFIR